MRFTVRHDTRYGYSVPVGLAPHVVRLSPRLDTAQLVWQQLSIDPWPSWRIDTLDRFGNAVAHVEFAGLFTTLAVSSQFELQTAPPPMLIDPGLPALPWPGSAPDGLDPYRWEPLAAPSVAQYAELICWRAGHFPLAFLQMLCDDLYASVFRHDRLAGCAQPPASTLASREGACRDITVLFMAACRHLGIPARFVSGYYVPPDSPESLRELHAWPEVWLPGLGWRGWDPTNGITTTAGHVALCAAPDQASTMPIAGGFIANGVTATLDYSIWISTGL